jgi:hypothetical protein
MSFTPPAGPISGDGLPRDQRMRALTSVLDWAEGEAAALRATDVGICLQLARLALQAHGRER